MTNRKETDDIRKDKLVSNDMDKDKKYSDAGRDGDYTTEKPASVEEGDEDYDDETMRENNKSHRVEDNDIE